MSSGFIFGNKILDVVFLSAFIAQAYKCISPLITVGKFDFRRLFSTGGMPSSHSSSTVSLACSVGLVKGFSTTEFAIATIFAIVTMYDATGIRQEAGKHAKILNNLMEGLPILNTHEFEELKEFLGHTGFEVLMGAILGIVISFIMKGYLLS
ncbi:divergent PAP2 family protein [Pseudostreptobacillus hongkongensis]|uniref:divergent PAP2 family protein n=1 Tax=Pseudostreptobacillus hongkongensis TaxID=1162717 RepID=UPI000835C764|nr:divergent PAP2 family protein [Pseudostreptobacillus hongkongensis]